MPDRVVALQLLSSYWLAVILPPALCFSAVYNERTSASSSGYSPYSHHQGRKFGGYKILPKPCKDTSSPEKEAGVCMFNYECTQRSGTVVGTCMDGFLYGTCCKLPAGVSVPTVNVPETTPSKPYSTSASDRSTTLMMRPHIEHSPEETYLLYKNGTVVQNVNSPDDFLFFSKQQAPSIPQTSPLPATNDDRLPSSSSSSSSPSNYKPFVTNERDRINTHKIPNSNIGPSQYFDAAMSPHTNKPTTVEHDRMSTIFSSRPYTSTSSREPFSPDFTSSSSSPNKVHSHQTTKLPPPSTSRSTSTKFNYHQSTTYLPTSMMTNKNDQYEDEDNLSLIRVPTLTVDGSAHKYGPNSSYNHIVWLLNETTKSEPDLDEISTQPMQSFYTWLSVQNNPDKGNAPYFSTKPIHTVYQDTKYSTPLPSTTVHHIPGPSFQVSPEVKITPKPQQQNSVGESAPPTVIVLGSPDTASTPPKKTVHNSYTTTASYNFSYQYPSVGPSSSKPYIQTVYPPQPSSTPVTPSERPSISNSVLITLKPTSSAYSPARPQPPNFITRPTGGEFISKPSSSVHVGTVYNISRPLTSLPLPTKPFKTPVTSTIQTSITKLKPPPSKPATQPTTLPPFLHTTLVTTATPVLSGNVNTDTETKPAFSQQPIPSYTSPFPAPYTVHPPFSSSYITLRPPTTGIYPPPTLAHVPSYSSIYPSTNIFINTTDSMFDFPPVRDPNVNLTATQQEKPIITSTTTFGDEDTESDLEVTPQFVVDKTLEDKMHVFVEKIVQSLQGNFEDLEKVLIVGESTNNVTVNTGPQKKPSSTKKPTKKPTGTKLSTRPPKPAITTLPVTPAVITKKPSKKPTLATPVTLFQPSSTSQTTINFPNKKPPIKVTTTVSISPSSSSTGAASSSSSPSEEESITTTKADTDTDEQESQNINYRRDCGIRPLARKHGRIVGGKGSTFGQWPWQVLVREATWLGLFTKNKCGGVLITNKYVITAAHCQPGFLANLVAVFGEFDISGEVESKRSVSKNVRRVIVHRQYDAATFENDIALLELESPIQFDSHIVPICMPEDNEDFTGHMATVTGWGRLKYGGGVPSVLQEVQVPVIENKVCQEMFHTAGHPKVILQSFLCAGYANGQRDSCEGDSGGPLMIEKPDGHWTLVATVSHGIKCAAPYLPGVYMRTTYYKPWLQTITGVQ